MRGKAKKSNPVTVGGHLVGYLWPEGAGWGAGYVNGMVLGVHENDALASLAVIREYEARGAEHDVDASSGGRGRT